MEHRLTWSGSSAMPRPNPQDLSPAPCFVAVFCGDDSYHVSLAGHPGLYSWTLGHQHCGLCRTHAWQPAAPSLDSLPALQGADSDSLVARPWRAGLPACTSCSPQRASRYPLCHCEWVVEPSPRCQERVVLAHPGRPHSSNHWCLSALLASSP